MIIFYKEIEKFNYVTQNRIYCYMQMSFDRSKAKTSVKAYKDEETLKISAQG